MKKLLLLAALFPATLSFASDSLRVKSISFNKDSIIKEDIRVKEEIIANPRAGFKNLFETAAVSTGFVARLNPQAVSFVQDYVQKHSNKLVKMKSWGRPYFDMMDDVLTRHGLPSELKYLSVIESQLKPYAVSWAGAVGPWQFMPGTAKLLGLRITRYKDERTDFTKSTHAAARYLTYLYGLYKDWLLVIAAYNGGPGRVDAAIRRSGSRNFWKLQHHLPAESRNHVKKFIATHYIMEGQGGVTTLTKSETERMGLAKASTPEATVQEELEVIPVSGKYNATVIAQYIQMSTSDFDRLNPGFDKQMAINGEYNLRLPADKALLFQANKPQILEGSVRLVLTLQGK